MRTGPRWVITATVAVLALAAARCGHDNRVQPIAPSPLPDTLSGTWVGTISDATSETGRLVVVLLERPVLDGTRSVLSGDWAVRFDNAARNGSGTVSGSVNNQQAAVDLRPTHAPSCPMPPSPFEPLPAGTWSLLVSTSPNALIGSSLHFTCGGALPGRVELSR